VKYLTVEQVLFLHSRVVEETGGSHGVRDIGLLESAPSRPQAIIEGEELYPDIFSKAAALMDSLIRNHCFIDGDKRTGVTAAAVFLRRNGWFVKASNRELESFTLQVTRSHLSIPSVAQWLREHCTPEIT